MMRFIELRSRQTKSGKVMPVNVTRPQAADSLVKFMYGQENKGKQACQKCKDGTGAFNAYVTLDEMSPGCATCHYGGAAKHCSLVSGAARDPATNPLTMSQLPSTRKSRRVRARKRARRKNLAGTTRQRMLWIRS
ncbi:hypothetical protein EDB80DRAFT_822386 [Ilyonectria destructans]|nr:hypothetical protein EDB80DRAFT_822386 [Ilyonectria destructans]